MILTFDIQYFGNISYYKILANSDAIIFNDFEEHRKMSLTNRCRIIGANGLLWLTIPLEGGRDQKTRIKDLRIDNRQSWQRRHWRSICSCYNRSPWFDHFQDELQLLFEKNYVYLTDCVLESNEWVVRSLGWQKICRLASSAEIEGYEGKAGQLGAFQQKEQLTDSYQQVFQERIGFVADVSILDLLFCEGPKKANEIIHNVGE